LFLPPVSSGKRVTPHRRSPLLGGGISVILFFVPGFLAACVRPPLTDTCTQIEPGALVVTELRGDQPGSYRQWIELYNASDEPVSVRGLRFSFTRLDGTRPIAFVVRDEIQEIAPGAYFVVGGGDPAEEDYIDYDYTPDYHSASNPAQPRDLYGAATLELYACDTVIDALVYQGLPAAGTLALDGSSPPDAALNDDRQRWCVDERDEGPKTEIGLRGSPGEANPPCP
jgi:hypothetical protein